MCKQGSNTAVINPESRDAVSAEPVAESVSPKSRTSGFGVAASPFNGVKIELGLSILLGALLLLGADSITADAAAQWWLFLGYGLLSMCWLLLRTRAVLRRCVAADVSVLKGQNP